MVRIELANKTAIVTGGGQGLGAATARRLHDAGAAVVINYFEDEQGANRRRAEETVAGLGDRAAAVAADVRDPQAITKMMQHAVERFGGVDILVNNAGILRDRSVKGTSGNCFFEPTYGLRFGFLVRCGHDDSFCG